MAGVFLVGMMGAGKTTVGRRLARRLGWPFVDADRELESRLGVPIQTIFELEGEEGFRRREAALIEELTRRDPVVLATGGGAVLHAANRQALASRGKVVYLRATVTDLWHRLRRDNTRPLLQTADPRARVEALVAARDPLYREVAHITLDTGRQPVDQVVERLFNELKIVTSVTTGAPMREIALDLGERSYRIEVGRGLIDAPADLIERIRGRMVAVVTDSNVAPLHGERLAQRLRPHAAALETVVMPAGEVHKEWATLNPLFDLLLGARFDRDAVIVAVGGGVVGDMAGFAAAIYQRGVDVVQVPTTLLAQVDSSVGGKTGINHPLGKNMIGAFHQPRAVLIDVDTLATLPDRELSAGLAEVIKHGAIADRAYFDSVVQCLPALRARDADVLIDVVARSCEIKAEVVGRDEREGGVRALLNFGHTFGHAIEAGLGYGEWLHGEAVGAGMVMAADLSVRLGRLDAEQAAQLQAAVAAAGLPTRGPAWPASRYIELMSVDKKAKQGIPRFVLLDRLGHASVSTVPEAALAETLAACSG